MKANNNGWTDERRKRQAELIHTWKPWVNSTGATTPEGKSISRMNARRITIMGLYRRTCLLCFFRKQWEKNGYSMPEHLKTRFQLFQIENDDWMENARTPVHQAKKTNLSKIAKVAKVNKAL